MKITKKQIDRLKYLLKSIEENEHRHYTLGFCKMELERLIKEINKKGR